jgi:hypothetical protein
VQKFKKNYGTTFCNLYLNPVQALSHAKQAFSSATAKRKFGSSKT